MVFIPNYKNKLPHGNTVKTQFQYKASQTNYLRFSQRMVLDVDKSLKKHADFMVRVKGNGSIFPLKLLSLTQTCCRYYDKSESREGGKGYSPIRNMMMMMMMMLKKEGLEVRKFARCIKISFGRDESDRDVFIEKS